MTLPQLQKAHAQCTDWLFASTVAGTGDEFALSIAVEDSSGNIYMTGYFSSSNLQLGNSTISTSGNKDMLLVKYDSNGNVLWVRKAGGSSDDQGYSVAIDKYGFVYVFGNFSSSSMSFGSTTLSNNGNEDLFLAKYDTSGQFIWAKRFGGSGEEDGYHVQAVNNNVYITGRFVSSSISFGSVSLSRNASGDMFLVKFDTSGTVVWAKNSDGATGYEDRGMVVRVDNANNVYLFGRQKSPSMKLGTYTLTKSGTGQNIDLFLAKYSPSGTVLWAVIAGGTGDDLIFGGAIDANNNLYLAGQFNSPTLVIGSTTLVHSGNNDFFIAKYNASGTPIWAKKAGGTGFDRANWLSLDRLGDVYVTGYFQSSSINFGNGVVLNSSGNRNIYLTKYNPSGTAVWGKSFVGNSNDDGRCVIVDSTLNIYLAGFYQSSTLNFGPIQVSNNGGQDIFLVKIGKKIKTEIDATNVSCKGGSNGSIDLTVSCGVAPYQYLWSTNDTTEDLTGLAAGIYVVYVTDYLNRTVVDSIEILEPDILSYSYTKTDESCYGDSNATIQLTVSGGTTPYSYLWNNNDTSQNLSNIDSGFYSVQITDSNGCVLQSDSILIIATIPIAPIITPFYSDSLCFGTKVEFELTNYQDFDSILWTNNEISSSITVVFTSDSVIGLTLRDKNSCWNYDSINVVLYPQPNTNFSINDTNQCLPLNSFLFQNTGSIPYGNYTTFWEYAIGDTSNTDSFQISYIFPDTFNVKLKLISNFGCEDSITKQVVVVEKPTIIAQSDGDTLCEGESKFFNVSVSGTRPLVYQWSRYGTAIYKATDSFLTFPKAILIDSGIYSCQVENFCGKDTAFDISFVVHQRPDINILLKNSSVKFDPEILWQKCYGGSSSDIPNSIIKASNNHYVFVGNSSSNDYDVSGNNGQDDYWVVKVDDTGNIIWQNNFGGSNYDYGRDIVEIKDTNYFVTGWTRSNDSDVIGNQGMNDHWNIKVDNTGSLQWQKCSGACCNDISNSVCKINDYSIVTGGESNSGNWGNAGVWSPPDIVFQKMTTSGNLVWEKFIRRNGHERCNSVKYKNNSIYAVGTNSVNSTNGEDDILVIRLDTNGNVKMINEYGGTLDDRGMDICIVEGGAVITGYTYSDSNFIVGKKGSVDLIVMKIDSNGSVLWKHRYGGSYAEMGYSIKTTPDGGFIITGVTTSNDKNVSTCYGNNDSWVIKLDRNGILQWEKNFGGTSYDWGYDILAEENDEYMVLSYSSSNDKDVSGSHGYGDVWLVKFRESFKTEFCEKDSLILETSVTGTQPITYQWFKNKTAIVGATAPNFIIPQTELSDSGFYFCVATNMCGIDTLEEVDVIIHPTPSSNFDIVNNDQCLSGNTFEFTGLSTIKDSVAYFYTWDFGDNASDTLINTSHTFATTDSYQVKLMNYTDFGCKDSLTKTLYVRPPPHADFYIKDSNQCLPLNSFLFQNTGSIPYGNFTTYWDYAIGDTSNTDSFQISFNYPDTFNIKLKLQSSFGCEDSITKQIVVVEKPTIIAQSDGDTLCEGESICFNVTASCTNPFTYQWIKNSQPIGGALDSFYCINDAESNDIGNYKCKLENGCGSDTSSLVNLWVNEKPRIYLNDHQSSTNGPEIVWQKCYGGTSSEFPWEIIKTTDNNFLINGTTASNNGDVSGNHGIDDYWALKINQSGNLLWQKCLGGTKYEVGRSLIESSNNKYLLTGRSNSVDGNVSCRIGTGDSDFWNVYLDEYGNIKSQNCVGGTRGEDAFCIAKLSENSFIIGGMSSSTNVGYSNESNNGDFFIAKIDAYGNVIWHKHFGGSDFDYCVDITIFNNEIYTTGFVWSSNGDFVSNNGVTDIPLIKLDTNGNLIWKKTFGGIKLDDGMGICSADNGIIITGSTESYSSFIDNPKGYYDLIAIKFDTSGSIVWKKRYGGSNYDEGQSIIKSSDNCYLISGKTASYDQDVKSNHGGFDSWVIKIDDNGNLIWEKNLGGSADDASFSVIENKRGEYIILSQTKSNDYDVSGNHGDGDVWIVKLKENFTAELCEKDSLILETSVTGTQPVTYQWFKNKTAIVGATAPNFIIPQASLSDSGWYYCIASNLCGVDTLEDIEVIVHPNPITIFSINDTQQCLNENKYMFNQSSTIINNDSISNVWHLGDGTIDTIQSLQHIYGSFDTFEVKLVTYSEHGCKDSMSKTVYVRPNPSAAFFINDSDQCLNNNLFSFTDTSSIVYGNISFVWDFGDSSTSTQKDPTHIFNYDDTFYVKSVVTSNYGCQDSQTKAIITFPMPEVVFNINDDSQCLRGNNFIFANLSTINSGIQYYQWDFGDSSISTSTNPSHSYQNFDTFMVKLKVVSDQSCEDSISQEIFVFPHPETAFEINDSMQCFKGNEFEFNNQSTIPYGNISYLWDFDNNQQSTINNPSINYSSPDTFKVKLLSTSNEGCTDSLTKTVYVHPTPVPNFTFNDSTQCFLNNLFQLTNASTISSGSMIYSWDFGNNQQSTTANPTISYSNADTFQIKLIAISNLNCSDSITKTAVVFPMPEANFSVLDSAQCLRENDFKFVNNSKIAQTDPLSYAWDFGDSDTSSLKNPNHTYSIYDTLNVTLIATSSKLCSDTFSRMVIIHPMPEADYFIWDTSQCFEKNAFGFTNKSTIPYGSIDYLWRFGDGGFSVVENPVHSYSYPDTFDVHLLAVSANGCEDSTWGKVYIHVHPEPVSSFSINDSAQCLSGNIFNFTNQSTISSGSYSQTWDFGDGDTLQSLDASHSYSVFDTLKVRLLVVSDWACKDSFEKAVIIHPMPTAGFVSDTNSMCLNNNIFKFTDQSNIIYGNINQYLWYFGDGNNSTQQNPTHSYNSVDSFQIKLVATSTNNCPDSVTKEVIVRPMPVAKFDIANSSQCLSGNNFQFINQSNIYYGNLDFLWDFGDNKQSTTSNPNHNYTWFDTFTMLLITNSDFNCKDTFSKTAIVHPMPTAAFSIHDSDQCLRNNLFEFLNHSNISQTNSLSYLWDFGNNQQSTINNPSISYFQDDLYTVKLLAISAQNCKDSTEKQLYVRPMPQASFEVNDTTQCLTGNHFVFTNLTVVKYGTLTYNWFIDKNNFPTFQPSNLQFKNWGKYPVQLIAESNYGCLDTASKILDVYPMPVSAFIFINNCLEDTMYFFDSSHVDSGAIAQWYWDFKNGDVSSKQNPWTIYYDTGYKSVTLVSTTDFGCATDTTRYFVIESHISAPNLERATVEENEYILVEWGKPIEGILKTYSLERSEDGNIWDWLSDENNEKYSYKDYHVEVSERPYYYRINATDSCDYTGDYSNLGKTILLTVDTSKAFPVLTWTAYEEWLNGVAGYELQVSGCSSEVNGCNGFQTLHSTLYTLHFADSLITLNASYYCYRVIAYRNGDSLQSVSNVVCVPTEFNLYFPNSFTPNGDGLNDIYKPKGTHVLEFNMKIYNRWGEKLFETDDFEKGWDGTFKGEKCPMGVYMVQVYSRGTTTQRKSYNSTVTLIR